MNYQKNRDRLKNIGNKSLQLSQFSEQVRGTPQLYQQSKRKKKKMLTQYSKQGPDSLQIFQQQLNSVIKGTRIKKKPAKKVLQHRYDTISNPSKQTIQIKNDVNEIKSMLGSQNELKGMQDRLQKILVELQVQKRQNQRSQRSELQSAPTTNVLPMQTSPYMMPQTPQYIYPPAQPPPYYYPPPPYYPEYPRHRSTRNRKYSDFDQIEDDSDYEKTRRKPKPKKDRQNSNQYGKLGNRKNALRTKLRMYFFIVAFPFFLRSQAKKLSALRKNNLKKFWIQNFQKQINNLKNWLLDSQKYSFSILLQKKNLNFKFFDDKSLKVKQQKQKLVMQIVSIGVSKLAQDAVPQKILLFSQLLLNLCRSGSFAINKFWTAQQMQQICISQKFGFFRIDQTLQKFLIVFIFNMLLQPSKFDQKNFPKKSQPLTTNMMLISSIYYYMVKEVINQFRDTIRDLGIYKLGNWLSVDKQFIVQCSQPLVYGSKYPQADQYISGLFKEEQLEQLKQHESWEMCTKKIKSIIQKLYTETVAKGKLVKKNLKYKLYS